MTGVQTCALPISRVYIGGNLYCGQNTCSGVPATPVGSFDTTQTCTQTRRDPCDASSAMASVGWRYTNATHVAQIIYNGDCRSDYGLIHYRCVPTSDCNTFTINGRNSSYNIYCSNSPPTDTPVSTIVGSVSCGVRDCTGPTQSSGLMFFSDNRCTVTNQNPCNASYPTVPVSWEMIGTNVVRQHIYSTTCPGNNFPIEYNCGQCYNITSLGAPFSFSFACGGTVPPTTPANTTSGASTMTVAFFMIAVSVLAAIL